MIDSDDTPSANTRVTINHHCLPAVLYLYFNPKYSICVDMEGWAADSDKNVKEFINAIKL